MANENSIDSTWDFTAPDQDNLFSKFISEPLDLLAIPSTKTENFSNSSLDAALPSGGADFITDISDLVLPSDIFDLATERSLYDQVQQLAETVANVQEKFQEEVSLRKQEYVSRQYDSYSRANFV
jgi:hypothetical protein